MYQSPCFSPLREDLMNLIIPEDRDYKILQLTDLHLGFGPLSRKQDRLALHAAADLIHKTKPDLIILTGDSIFPYLPKTGTLNNRKQARLFLAFMDRFRIPYTMVFGNHDCEMGSFCQKEELADIFSSGKYCIFSRGKSGIYGVGNFILDLTDSKGTPLLPLVLLDSNMYGNGWFYSGFDRIHEDQTDWCMQNLDQLKKQNPAIKALAFFHMPLREYKTAYARMKSGDPSVQYNFGSICEADEYFGISNRPGTFFKRAVQNGIIKGMFCGHDHLNTLSLTYQGIQLTYGMSIDYLGYKNIAKKYTQRGGTLITRKADGSLRIAPVPLGPIVSTRVRGEKKKKNV